MIKIDYYQINAKIEDILDKLTLQTSFNFTKRKVANDYLMICCPFHKGGKEQHPSCGIVFQATVDHEIGDYHCFTCGEVGNIIDFIAFCLGKNAKGAKDWLLKNFTANLVNDKFLDLPAIELTKKVGDKKEISEKILNSFSDFHPYMLERKLALNVCKKFQVKYDPKYQSIVFPVRDETGKLVMLTRRNVNNKQFIIDKDVDKPVYLLDYIIKNNIDTCIVAESQINALTCYSYGLPAIALIGTGSSKQYKILNKSSIRYYILCLDGDDAGKHGVERFLKNIRKDVFVDVIEMPKNKDINDCSKDEFFKILETNGINVNDLSNKIKNKIV